MFTKKQHYYPRCLIKHFANEDKKLYAYIMMTNKVKYLDYKNVCAENYTYETFQCVDNILENELSSFENKVSPIIDNICDKKWEKLNESDIELLFKYIFLQYIRTDSGRIGFIRSFGNINYIPRKYPYNIEEIKESKNREILEFNYRFKQKGVLKNLLKIIKKPYDMNFHIVKGKNFITSDNPVVGLDEGNQIYMPISPDYCISFQHNSINPSKEIISKMTDEKNKYINESQIETANYYIMSKEKFDLITNLYIYRRFNEIDWNKKSKHI